MGLLDKVVKEEITKNEQKTKKDMEKFSAEVLELKKEQEIAEFIKPLIAQALKEFAHAMEQIGVEPLPLVVKRDPTFLESFLKSEIYKCVWGYYLYPKRAGYELFITADGRFLEGYLKKPNERVISADGKRLERYPAKSEGQTNGKFRMEKTILQTPDVFVYKNPDGTRGELYSNRSSSYYEKELSEDEAVSLIIQDFLYQRKYPKEDDYGIIKYPRLTKAMNNEDFETAVIELFSTYIEANKKIWNEYRGERIDFLRSMYEK